MCSVFERSKENFVQFLNKKPQETKRRFKILKTHYPNKKLTPKNTSNEDLGFYNDGRKIGIHFFLPQMESVMRKNSF
ncbi:hypothetical protein CH361_10950 [Leptospira brenneri]|nr:hypothetical protein CH361_10950 [Leptospira brenneri]